MPPKQQNRRRLNPVSTDGDAEAPPPLNPPAHKYSQLGTKLLSSWAWGCMPATEVQRAAHAAHLDGLTHPEITTLASLGTFGTHPGNAHAELMRKHGDTPLPT
eukprot:2009256-Pyramimonas_sp.AAC.1